MSTTPPLPTNLPANSLIHSGEVEAGYQPSPVQALANWQQLLKEISPQPGIL